jgi:hypothetical protein
MASITRQTNLPHNQPRHTAQTTRGENMKSTFRKLAFISALVLIAQFSSAAEITFGKLVGEWESETQNVSGDTIEVQLEITADHIFSGIVFENRVPVWTYAGTCELNGNELTWTYEHSTKPLEPNTQDIDVIQTIDAQKFTYTSKLTGEPGSYDRVH